MKYATADDFMKELTSETHNFIDGLDPELTVNQIAKQGYQVGFLRSMTRKMVSELIAEIEGLREQIAEQNHKQVINDLSNPFGYAFEAYMTNNHVNPYTPLSKNWRVYEEELNRLIAKGDSNGK